MIKLLEPELLLKVRKEDQAMVKELIPECEQEFVDIMKKETSGETEYKCKLTLLENETMSAEQGSDCGGVILFNVNRKIVCNNTLKSRLDLCFEELLPQIRSILFP